MRQKVSYLFRMKVSDHLVHVLAQLQNHLELGFRDMQHYHMHLAAVFREMGRDLRADERVWQVGNFQRAADGVMISNGNEIHAPLAGGPVQIVGRGVAFGDIEFTHGPIRGLI